MTKAIKGIFCTHIRRKTHISVNARIVAGEPVFINGSAHCRYHSLYGCEKAENCPKINAALEQWIAEGAYL